MNYKDRAFYENEIWKKDKKPRNPSFEWSDTFFIFVVDIRRMESTSKSNELK